MTIFCGAGCAGAHAEVVALAEKLKAPVGYSFRGKEWVEYDNPYAVGMTGLLGWGSAYQAMHGCDVLLLLGTDFPYEAFMPSHHHRSGRHPPRAAGPPLQARPGPVRRRGRYDPRLAAAAQGEVRSHVSRRHARTPQDGRAQAPRLRRPGQHAQADSPRVGGGDRGRIRRGRRRVHCRYRDVRGSGARYLHATKARRILGSFNHGSMANALPQAIGGSWRFPSGR